MSHLPLPVPLNVHAKQQAVLEDAATKSSPQKAFPVPHPTVSFWQTGLEITPPPDFGSEGGLTTDADICIIGSGITGWSAAYHLAKTFAEERSLSRPIRAVILEARDFCSGATGRNGGHLTANLHESFAAREKLYGREEALRQVALEQHNVAELLKVVREANQEAELDLVSGGHVELFFSQKEYDDAKEDYAAAQAAGVDVRFIEWLSKEDVQAQYGASYPGVRLPGNNLWPLKAVGLLYNLAKDHTPSFVLDLHTRTPATSITRLDAARWSVSTPRGSIACTHVLHATNAYVSHLLPHLYGPAGVIPARGQVLALRAAAPADVLTKAAWGANEGFEYWFPRPVKAHEAAPLVILGGGREAAAPRYELYEIDDSRVDEDIGKAMRAFLPSVFPGNYEAGREPEAEWSGIMGFTKTGDPFVGPVVDASGDAKAFEGQYLSAGFSGHGMPRAFACAEAVAGMIASNILGRTWMVPDWMPKHYLTVAQ
ncbi:FAD dependent oxidoreductase [Phanerochaete sordida]|uniref:FAD dependent oxidoreductase n=1 Tax=Phanerochaete sordida TaxID=48140 RepID=A0A9P3GFE3_9APHY|nr:FAD dependent oxidoreductase [Phanerochaete sordida]